ncbi:hypothetical protein RRG08_038618 [Elysia crispata]|uniref:LIM zinc-binding domain-containing protein n=1 Tax=Elysia crispata TaxID=231223 RepID=A0AAE0YKV0_9GAST|nr:hypothetical protein RRG08_038618 [Elysia crispata]
MSRRFAVKNCARCQQPISANELIMRAREQVFHLTCFACTACHRTLKSGEQYGLRDGLLYCRMDYELMFQGEFGLPGGHLSPGILGGGGGGGHLSPGGGGGGGGGGPGGGHIAFYNGVGAVQKGRPRKRKIPMSDADGCPPLAKFKRNLRIASSLQPALFKKTVTLLFARLVKLCTPVCVCVCAVVFTRHRLTEALCEPRGLYHQLLWFGLSATCLMAWSLEGRAAFFHLSIMVLVMEPNINQTSAWSLTGGNPQGSLLSSLAVWIYDGYMMDISILHAQVRG